MYESYLILIKKLVLHLILWLSRLWVCVCSFGVFFELSAVRSRFFSWIFVCARQAFSTQCRSLASRPGFAPASKVPSQSSCHACALVPWRGLALHSFSFVSSLRSGATTRIRVSIFCSCFVKWPAPIFTSRQSARLESILRWPFSRPDSCARFGFSVRSSAPARSQSCSWIHRLGASCRSRFLPDSVSAPGAVASFVCYARVCAVRCHSAWWSSLASVW
jgi:hypothetical protein